ncbi:[FeFe] hydrogenase H-cluster radical SAM maturase HydE [Patescibacteria group bacterium]|nr:[FeFe] hydrogenase H-cluster radical SAM maturase HydE [Patescibacteria group bacterium]
MCYAIPGKIVKLKNNLAVVDYFGEKRNVLNDFLKVKVNDYIYAQGGIIVNKIPAKEAKEILAFWREKFFELKKIDNKLSQVKKNQKISSNILAILQKVNLKQSLTNKELLKLLNVSDEQELKLLFATANNIRQKENDNACCVHGIIEFSNYCQNDCYYCGIRKSCRIPRYRMSLEEIIKTAKSAVNNFGFKALVLQSGEDFWYDEKKLIKLVKEIRKLNILIFLSIGERSKRTYKKLFAAGARAVLLRFETSNKKIYQKLRPGKILTDRVELIKHLKKLSYILATGFLTGLPGETKQDIINNILLTKSLKADMYSFGPLIPAFNTPLAKQKMIAKDLMLKIIAITRFIERDAKILVTTAMETLDKKVKEQGLLAGANSLMINVTPSGYRKKYVIYPARADKNKEIKKNIKETLDLLYSLGRAPTDVGT